MPKVRVNGVELHYAEYGSGQETVVFSHSYLTDHRHYEQQIIYLARRFRIIAYDHRDCGESERARGPYQLSDLVADAAALIEATRSAPCHFVGLSTGGFVGMRLALYHRELLRSLVLLDTSGGAEPRAKRLKYKLFFAVLRAFGIKPLMGTALRAMFSPRVLRDPEHAELLATWKERIAANDPDALIRFGNAIFGRDDVLDALRQVEIPALVATGAEDAALPPIHARRLASALRGSRFEIIENAGHLSTVEQPDIVCEFLGAFYDSLEKA